MKRKGFTLIELLAVIVVLAIIALISTPVILKVIERARKGAFEDSAYGVANAAKIYFADKSFDGKVDKETFTFPEDTKLKLSGEKPKSGSVRVDENGKVEMAISNGVWCALKSKDEEKVRIIDYSIDECEIGLVPSTDASCFTVNETGETITDYTCEDKDVVIPRKINGVPIIEIEDHAFYEKQLSSVVIPDSVTSIGAHAFQRNQLSSVVIPENVTIIRNYAFSFNRLSSIVIPENVTIIETSAFYANQLTSVTMPNSVTFIQNSAFQNNQLRSIIIPKNVTSILIYAFADNQLSSIVIEGTPNIGGAAFNDNRLPDDTAFIYERNSDGTENKNTIVSYGGARRKDVIVPSGVTNIRENAFQRNDLKSVEIPSSVTSIGNYAFAYNDLTGIEVPSSVTSIGIGAFSYNESAMKVTVHKAENSISGSPWGASSVEWIDSSSS